MRKEKIRIKAPVNSLKLAQGQVRFGADELYLGLDSKDFANLSYTGRGRKTWEGRYCHVQEAELKDIVAYAHQHGVEVSYAANTPILYEDLEDKFLKYIEKGIEAGVDSIILGSLEAILLLKEHGFPARVIASVFMECYNEETVRWLTGFGITEITLPHHLTLDEIRALTQIEEAEFSVFGHFGCANSNGCCFLAHQAGEDINVGIPCRGGWSVCMNGQQMGIRTILDAGMDCSICFIKGLQEAGVRSLKIVGRDKDLIILGSLTKIYRDAIDAFWEGRSVEEVKQQAIKAMPLFEMHNCTLGRCKYASDTNIARSFI